jgi:hypothetical protein
MVNAVPQVASNGVEAHILKSALYSALHSKSPKGADF